MRVLQGVTGQAGQPQAIAEGLRAIGIDAETCFVAKHKFGYAGDRYLDLSDAHTLEEVYARLWPVIREFDVFHFHARSFLSEWPKLRFPALLDLFLIKLHGKKVFFHFRGSEIRLAAEFAALNPFHYADEPDGRALFAMIPDATKIQLRDILASVCDGIFVTDPELQGYVPGSLIVPRALADSQWSYVGVSDRAHPVVVHAPSRKGIKGTQYLVAAVEELRAEGIACELRLIENMQHARAVAAYRDADILVDQLRIGWYGVLACEGMALGKPVIAYIREDLWENHGDKLPIVNANPLTIKDRLRDVLLSRDRRVQLGTSGRAYHEQVHSATKVAALLKELYATQNKMEDVSGLARLLDSQHKNARKLLGRRANLLIHTFRNAGFLATCTLVANYAKRKLGAPP